MQYFQCEEMTFGLPVVDFPPFRASSLPLLTEIELTKGGPKGQKRERHESKVSLFVDIGRQTKNPFLRTK